MVMNTRLNAIHGDPWDGVSHDVISRFLDVLTTEHALARKTRVAYRADLHKLDGWMQLTRRCTAVAASSDDLDAYFAQQLLTNCSQWAIKRARNSARRFYGFLRDCHYREDDPMDRPEIVWAASPDAVAEGDLEVAA
jgi:site-specific recombinase XerD